MPKSKKTGHGNSKKEKVKVTKVKPSGKSGTRVKVTKVKK